MASNIFDSIFAELVRISQQLAQSGTTLSKAVSNPKSSKSKSSSSSNTFKDFGSILNKFSVDPLSGLKDITDKFASSAGKYLHALSLNNKHLLNSYKLNLKNSKLYANVSKSLNSFAKRSVQNFASKFKLPQLNLSSFNPNTSSKPSLSDHLGNIGGLLKDVGSNIGNKALNFIPKSIREKAKAGANFAKKTGSNVVNNITSRLGGSAARTAATAGATGATGSAAGGIAAVAGRLGVALTGLLSTIPVVGQVFLAIVAGATLLVGAFVAVVISVKKFAESLIDSQKYLAKYSGVIAGAVANLNIRDIKRDIKTGSELGPSFTELTRAFSDFKDALQPITTGLTKLINIITTGILRTLTVILNGIFDVLKAIAEFLHIKFNKYDDPGAIADDKSRARTVNPKPKTQNNQDDLRWWKNFANGFGGAAGGLGF